MSYEQSLRDRLRERARQLIVPGSEESNAGYMPFDPNMFDNMDTAAMLRFIRQNSGFFGGDNSMGEISIDDNDPLVQQFLSQFGIRDWGDVEAPDSNNRRARGWVMGYGDPTYGRERDDGRSILRDPSRILRLPDGRYLREEGNIDSDEVAGQQRRSETESRRGLQEVARVMAAPVLMAAGQYAGLIPAGEMGSVMAAAPGQGFGTALGTSGGMGGVAGSALGAAESSSGGINWPGPLENIPEPVFGSMMDIPAGLGAAGGGLGGLSWQQLLNGGRGLMGLASLFDGGGGGGRGSGSSGGGSGGFGDILGGLLGGGGGMGGLLGLLGVGGEYLSGKEDLEDFRNEIGNLTHAGMGGVTPDDRAPAKDLIRGLYDGTISGEEIWDRVPGLRALSDRGADNIMRKMSARGQGQPMDENSGAMREWLAYDKELSSKAWQNEIQNAMQIGGYNFDPSRAAGDAMRSSAFAYGADRELEGDLITGISRILGGGGNGGGGNGGSLWDAIADLFGGSRNVPGTIGGIDVTGRGPGWDIEGGPRRDGTIGGIDVTGDGPGWANEWPGTIGGINVTDEGPGWGNEFPDDGGSYGPFGDEQDWWNWGL